MQAHMDSLTLEVEAMVAEGNRLIGELEALLAAHDRHLAENNIDPQACLEYVRKRGGEAAVKAVQAEAQATLQGIRDRAEARSQHAVKARPAAQRARVRSNLV